MLLEYSAKPRYRLQTIGNFEYSLSITKFAHIYTIHLVDVGCIESELESSLLHIHTYYHNYGRFARLQLLLLW